MDSPATIIDVAKLAGVAISSASSALNGRPGVSDATRRRVQDAAAALGFVPSLRGRSLSTKRAYAVGLIVSRDAEVFEEDPFFGGFLAGIESVLAVRGFALVLQMSTTPEENTERYRRMARDRRVDGVFLNEITLDDPRIPLLRELQLPAVAITEARVDWTPAVVHDNTAVIRELVDYLFDLGHRRFAHVSGPREYLHSCQRRNAWLDALRAHGISTSDVTDGDFTYAGGAAAASKLLARDPNERPSAVFCANDLTAAGFQARALDLGFSVPDDLSIAGYDGTALSTYVRPALTTLTTSPHTLGATAASLLLDRIDGLDAVDVQLEQSRLVIRDSTGPVPVA
jgi:DNA-binding LacI/PurR family transcriptional regulator